MTEEIESKTQHSLSYIDLIRLSTRVFRVKPMRSILTILGTSIGIGTVVFLVSLGYGLQYIVLGKLVTTEDSLISMEATYPQESNLIITPADLDNFSKLPNVKEVVSVAEFPADIVLDQGSPGVFLGRIVNPEYFRLSGVGVDIGKEFTNDSPGVVLSLQGARSINLIPTAESLGKLVSVKVYYQNADGTAEEVSIKQQLPIVGFVTNQSDSAFVLIPMNVLPVPPPVYKSFLAKVTSAEFVIPVRDAFVEKGLFISAKLDLVNQSQKILSIFTIILGVFGITALSVSAVGMFNTMVVSFMERTYEVGVMKSLGALDSDVRNLFLMESVIMGILGGVVGIASGMGLGAVVNFTLNVFAKRFGSPAFSLFITPIWFIALIIVTSAIIGLVSGFLPSRRASQLSPKDAFLRK